MERPMMEKQIPSAKPLYLAAVALLALALILPIYRWWALLLCAVGAGGVYALAKKMIPPRTVLVPVPSTVFATGEAGLDKALAQAEKDLDTLAALNGRIADAELSRSISRMENAGRAILKRVAEEPGKAKGIRKFATYYLPTAIKVLTTYADLAASGAKGENAQALERDVKQNAALIAKAFEAQLDALFAGEVLDVTSDLDVLEAIAKSEGLLGDTPAGGNDETKPTLTL